MRSWKAERTRQAGVSVLLAERMLGVTAEDVHGEVGSSVPLLSWLPGEGRPIRGGQAEMGPREESKVPSTSLRSTEHPRPRSALAASLPCSSRSLRRPSTSGWGAGPSTLLVFGALGLWPRPHLQSFWFGRLVRWEPRDYKVANIALGTCLV